MAPIIIKAKYDEYISCADVYKIYNHDVIYSRTLSLDKGQTCEALIEDKAEDAKYYRDDSEVDVYLVKTIDKQYKLYYCKDCPCYSTLIITECNGNRVTKIKGLNKTTGVYIKFKPTN